VKADIKSPGTMETCLTEKGIWRTV